MSTPESNASPSLGNCEQNPLSYTNLYLLEYLIVQVLTLYYSMINPETKKWMYFIDLQLAVKCF